MLIASAPRGRPCQGLTKHPRDISLLGWYREHFAQGDEESPEDPILSLRGLGKGLWEDESAEVYVRRLRERSG